MGHWSYHDKVALSHRCKHLRKQYNAKCNFRTFDIMSRILISNLVSLEHLLFFMLHPYASLCFGIQIIAAYSEGVSDGDAMQILTVKTPI